jgi:hypothetical protein
MQYTIIKNLNIQVFCGDKISSGVKNGSEEQ